MGDASLLGGSLTNGIGGHLYLGIGPFSPADMIKKDNSVGAKLGYRNSKTQRITFRNTQSSNGSCSSKLTGSRYINTIRTFAGTTAFISLHPQIIFSPFPLLFSRIRIKGCHLQILDFGLIIVINFAGFLISIHLLGSIFQAFPIQIFFRNLNRLSSTFKITVITKCCPTTIRLSNDLMFTRTMQFTRNGILLTTGICNTSSNL
ncbi:membrane protein [Beggiatoa sp. SS]|nr:membrane protein [Beggiatoa sp. SS]